MTAAYVNAVSLCCALGDNVEQISKRLTTIQQQADSPLQRTDAYSANHPVPLGVCTTLLPDLPAGNERFACRNNQLLWHLYSAVESVLDELIEHSSWQRVGLVLGTSTSGIQQAEIATSQRIAAGELPDEYHFIQQQLSGGSDFLLANTQIGGPSYSVSTACSSSGHALASAKRLIEMDLCDIVIAGGADTLCQFTVQGFSALEAVSPELTNPFSTNRRGINLGEGGGLFVVSKYPGEIALLGVGASTDAHHISAPHPEGKGALAAMTQALRDADISPLDVSYLNLHGTGTAQNDSAEGFAVNALFGDAVPCSSTKPLTGHTLGAAGIVEAALCWLMLSPTYNPDRTALPHLYDGEYDPQIGEVRLAVPGSLKQNQNLSICLSNSFAFGGNNAAIILGLVEA